MKSSIKSLSALLLVAVAGFSSLAEENPMNLDKTYKWMERLRACKGDQLDMDAFESSRQAYYTMSDALIKAYTVLLEVETQGTEQDNEENLRRLKEGTDKLAAELRQFFAGLREEPFVLDLATDSSGLSVAKDVALAPAVARGTLLIYIGPPDGEALPECSEMDVHLSKSRRIVLSPSENETPRMVLVNLYDIPEGITDCLVEVQREAGECWRFPVAVAGLPAATLQVRVRDEHGALTPVRAAVYIGHELYRPANALPIDFLGNIQYEKVLKKAGKPDKDNRVFFTGGEFSVLVPPGSCTLRFQKGAEYLRYEETVSLEAGQTVERDITLTRWVNMPEKGWYSGDPHVHIPRASASDNAGILQLARAEDIHATHLLQFDDYHADYCHQYAWREASRARTGNYAIQSGQEAPRTNIRGHTITLNASRFVRDQDNYYVYEDVLRELRDAGGITGYAHFGKMFEAENGLTISAPLGLVDFLEVVQMRTMDTDVLYHFWNLGYPLTPTGGSDYPFGDVIGSAKTFVHVDGPFTMQAWCEGLQAGHTVASDGPIIEFTVNETLPGDELTLKKRAALNVRASVRLNPSLDALDRVEIVRSGEVVTSKTSEGNDTIDLDLKLSADQSVWLAARAYGANTFAHTAAVYCIVDGQPWWENASLAAETTRAHESLERFDTLLDFEGTDAAVKANAGKLRRYMQQAHDIYAGRLDASETKGDE